METPDPSELLAVDHLGAACRMDIERYYAAAAPHYDRLRFGSGYGRYLDRQERALLRAWLPSSGKVLDLGCGTGRFLDLATDGVDRSPEMLAVARVRHPGRCLVQATASRTPFAAGEFDAVFSMHLFMHLPKDEIARILGECRRLLGPGGTMIFDVPSKPRRDVTGFVPEGWHCGTSFEPEELRRLTTDWTWRGFRGSLAFPVHRIPERARPLLRPFDSAVGRTPLKRWCSYYLVRLEKPRS